MPDNRSHDNGTDHGAFAPAGADDAAWGGFGPEDMSTPPGPMLPPPPAPPAAPAPAHTTRRPAPPVEEIPDWASIGPAAHAPDLEPDTELPGWAVPVAPTRHDPPAPAAYQPPPAPPARQQPAAYQPPPPAAPAPPARQTTWTPGQPDQPRSRFARPTKEEAAAKQAARKAGKQQPRQRPAGAGAVLSGLVASTEPGGTQSGGRWQRTLFRGLAYGFLGLTLLIGLRHLFFPTTPPSTEDVATSVAAKLGQTGFPVQAGEAFAARFADAYLNYDADATDARTAELAKYISATSAAVDSGWDGTGKQTIVVGPFVAAAPQLTGTDRAVVTVAARTDKGTWLYLAVPLFADKAGHLAVAGTPAYVPAPAKATVPPPPAVNDDAQTSDALRTVLPGFFAAWAAGDQATLNQYVTTGTDVGGLGGNVTFGELGEVKVPVGTATTRDAQVGVTWKTVSGAKLSQNYVVTVTFRDDIKKWYVSGVKGGAPF